MNTLRTGLVRIALSLVLAGCILLPVADSAHAQGTDVIVTIDDMDTSTFPTILVGVSVRNRKGVPIPELQSEHFEIIEDGASTTSPSDVKSESSPYVQVSLAIVIDMYKTLSGDPIAAAQQATGNLLTDLLDESNDPDRAAFIGIRSAVSTNPAEIDSEYEVPFTNDRNGLLNVINFLHERMETSAPGTALYDAAIKAIRLTAATEPVGHRAVIVMTDGEDRGSINKDSDTIQSASDERIPVYTVGLSNNRLNEQYLRRLAEQSGGVYQEAETPDDFSPLFSNVLTTLRTHYVLTYDSGLPQDGQQHSVMVRVRTRTGLWGVGETRIQPEGAAAEPEATEPTETNPVEEEEEPQSTPPQSTPTPETVSPEPESGVSLPEWATTIRDWVEDNMLAAILGVGAIGLLFLVLVIIIIIAIRRRGRIEEEMMPSLPEPPVYPIGDAMAFPETGPDLAMATTGGPPDAAGTQLADFGIPPAPAPTAVEPPPPLFGPPPAPPTPVAGPAAPPPPYAGPGVQAGVSGGTRILSREPRMAKMGLLIDRKHPDRRFDIGKPTVTIGRGQGCDVVLDDSTVSRQHATVKLERDQFRLYDLGSSNGTFVGGQRVRAPVTLEDGAVVRFGELECVFKIVSLNV